MSYNVYAFVFQGAKIPRHLFVLQEEKRGCQHDSWMTSPYCPKCGAKRIASDPVYVDGYAKKNNKWRGYTVIFYPDFVLVGRKISTYIHDGELERFELADISHKTFDVFTEYEFGLWLIGSGG